METLFDPESKRESLKDLQKKSLAQGFRDDAKAASQVMSEISSLKDDLSTYDGIQKDLEDNQDLLDLFEMTEEGEGEVLKDVEENLEDLSKRLRSFKIKTQLDGPYDKNNVYMVIHAGAGGLEATDWASMLLRMYRMYFEDKGYKYEIQDLNNEEEAGIKSCTIHVIKPYAYGYLKSEKGVHRLVRISPFDSQSRRHTSFASVDIFPELDDSMEIDINPKDLRIDTFRSSGKGGQHVNKTDSAVRITHLPTGVVASSQAERSQTQNKETAMKMLYAKLVQIKEEEHREKIEDIQGSYSQIARGSQIRSYVFQPYTLVKDHRTGYEVGNVEAVMDGDIQGFIDAYLSENN